MKKILSILLALGLLLGCVPLRAAAMEPEVNLAAPPAEAGCSETEWEVLKQTNLVRWEEARLDPLTTFGTLQEAAGIRAQEQTRLFGHDRPDGRSWSSVGEEVGLNMMMNENVAAGYGSPEAVVNGWRNSPAHYNGIMGAWANHYTNPDGFWSRKEGYGYTMHLGVGHVGDYWVQLFQGKNPYSGSISAEINGYDTDEEAIADHLKNDANLCLYTDFRLLAPEAAVSNNRGITEMGIVGVLTCRLHGDCYFPVLSEYCTGYDPDVTGIQNITARCHGMTAQCSIVTTASEEIHTPEAEFSDVGQEDYFFAPVQWAVEQGITGGTGDNTFSPNLACTRAQVVTFLWRTAGSPEPVHDNNPFLDVSEGDYYCKAVLWAVEQGITGGTGENTFSPNQVCTRAQVVTFLWRFSGSPEVSDSEEFTDIPAGKYYAGAVSWAVEQGISGGVGDGKFGPDNVCTRAQVMTFLWRASGSPDSVVTTEHSHSWVEEVIEPLCTGCGYTRKVCTSCGVYAVLEGSHTDPAGHEYVTTVVPPTEKDTGYTIEECARCGLTYRVYDQ